MKGVLPIIASDSEFWSDKVHVYAKMQIELNRRQVPSKMPEWLKAMRKIFCENLILKAKKSFEETGIWFLSRGEERITDEQETMAVWGDLLTFYELQDIPYYSEENHREAIEFWRGWQNLKTGRLYNPLYQDPQHPEIKRKTPGNRDDYSPEKINLKYIPNILAKLGAELPLPCKVEAYEANTIDTFDCLWEHIERWESSPSGMFIINAANELENGNIAKVPQIEAGMSALIRGYNKETGIWHPSSLKKFPWSEYTPSAEFKIISRICGYIGMENFPQDKLKTSIDNLLAHKKDLLLGQHPAMARNYAESMVHRLLMTDYRHGELLDAMEYCLKGFMDKKLWLSTESSGYCSFGSALIGLFMNWEDELPIEKIFPQLFRFGHGCEMKYRFVAGPYGNWVNIIPKEPEAIFGHPEYDVNKYGLKARNKVHWRRKITDIVPQQEVMLELANDKKSGKGRFIFTLTESQVENLKYAYLKATWNGAYDVALNGEPVKQVRYNLPDIPAGWYIPHSAAKKLRVGQNIVEVKLVNQGKEQKRGTPLSKSMPFIQLGLIDWS